MNNTHIYAPNTHTGGGLMLLKYFLQHKGKAISSAEFDIRVKDKLDIPPHITYNFVKLSIFSRVLAEFRIFLSSLKYQEIYFFNCLPPLLPNKSIVNILVQNRLLIDREYISCFTYKVKIRLLLESIWLKLFHRKRYNYIVPTQSMHNLLINFLGKDTKIKIVPFILDDNISEKTQAVSKKEDSFIYISSGEPHKNHLNLIKAWKALKNQGFNSKLVLTINEEQYTDLVSKIEDYKNRYNLNIENVGEISPAQVNSFYQNSKALIFPSFVESFGLPLIEAQKQDLPIIAPEKDYVRDVCNPVETFDPHSIDSISYAIIRFINVEEKNNKPIIGSEFLLKDL